MKQLENDQILTSYKFLLDFLVAAYGQQDIILYEIDAEQSGGKVIASTNKRLIGKELGPIEKRVLENSKKGYHYLINAGDTQDLNGMQKKKSYFLIRNSANDVIGILLVSFDIDFMLKAKHVLDQLLGFKELNNRPIEHNDLYYELEMDAFSIGKYANDIIKTVIDEFEIPVERMTMDEKAEIISKLDKMEVFNIKGTVRAAANHLKISTATIYRLMKR